MVQFVLAGEKTTINIDFSISEEYDSQLTLMPTFRQASQFTEFDDRDREIRIEPAIRQFGAYELKMTLSDG